MKNEFIKYLSPAEKAAEERGYNKAMELVKSAISEGTRCGSSLCAQRLKTEKFNRKNALLTVEDLYRMSGRRC